jgi:hypothetical protein
MNPLRSAINRTLLALGGAPLLAGGGWLFTTALVSTKVPA